MLLLALFACQTEAEGPSPRVEDTSVRWTELSEEELEAEEGKDDTGKDEACGPEVVLGEACEGGWQTTLCGDEQGEYWWCEDGVWTTGK